MASLRFTRRDSPPHTMLSLRATHGLPLPSNPCDRMLGYPTVFTDCMFRVNRYPHARVPSSLRTFLFLAGLTLTLLLTTATPFIASAQQGRLSSAKGGVANLEAKTQGRKGDVTTADGDVDLHYGDTRLRAD